MTVRPRQKTAVLAEILKIFFFREDFFSREGVSNCFCDCAVDRRPSLFYAHASFREGVKPKMGARGPTKKPAELEKLHGNPGHRKTENRLQFSKPEKVPSPPVFLNKIAKKEWKRLAPIVFNAGMLTDADVGTFAAYCDSYAQWVLAEKAIQAKQRTKILLHR